MSSPRTDVGYVDRSPSSFTPQEGSRAVERSPRAREDVHIELKDVVQALPYLQGDRCACFAGFDSIATRIVEKNFLSADLHQDRGKVAGNAEERRASRIIERKYPSVCYGVLSQPRWLEQHVTVRF